ncbi:MAG: beta-galactosidase, partial [Planctomycetes bacterium]|nr:beta-galactosidase [Planctomycetota bacterium]
RGGHTPFFADVTEARGTSDHIEIVVRAEDDPHDLAKPRGKQDWLVDAHEIWYPRTSGIWQTVWLEPVPETRLERPRVTPDWRSGGFLLEQGVTGARGGMKVRATLSHKGEQVAVAEEAATWPGARLQLSIAPAKRRAWSVTDPHLYDLAIELRTADGTVVDHARSYAGLRSIAIDGTTMLINDQPVFQRLVLDQGYWADGIMTAPSDAALVRDITLAQEAGFNGARLHQKVFEERFLYHADRLGYLCWGEFADWGTGPHKPEEDYVQPGATFVSQWLEAVERDYSHPSIVGWCPLNETHQDLTDRITGLDDLTRAMFAATKLADRTRPVLDTSGYSHRIAETDVYDCHDYEQDPAKFRANQAGLGQDKPYINTGPNSRTWSLPYAGQPYFVSEFGGIWWNPKAKPGEDSWGYGQRPKNVEEFHARFAGLCDVLIDDAKMFGYCYTQLTDVFQEQNGIYGFDRSVKFDMQRIRAVQSRIAAIEQQAPAAAAAAAAAAEGTATQRTAKAG